MAMTVNAKLSANWTIDETLPILGSAQQVEGVSGLTDQFVPGTSGTANAVDGYFAKLAVNAVTLTAGASVTYTLTALVDPMGRTVTFAGGVRGFWIRVLTRTAGDFLTVGAAATNPWTAMFAGTTPAIKVFKFFCVEVDLTDKYAVTAASNEQLKIVNSGSNSITFELGLVGCSS